MDGNLRGWGGGRGGGEEIYIEMVYNEGDKPEQFCCEGSPAVHHNERNEEHSLSGNCIAKGCGNTENHKKNHILNR